METWTKRYAPKKLSEVVGQLASLRELISFVNSFPSQKAALLYGPTGVGKTASLHALAEELNYEVVELNASDKRNKSSIEEILLPACQQASIFGSKKLIVIDEVDDLSGTADRGGASALAEVIKTTKFPIVLTANDPFSDKLKSLTKICKLIQFNPIDSKSIVLKLKAICSAEGIAYEEIALEKLALSAIGDMRAAVTDLQTMSSGKKSIKLEDLKQWGRERDEKMSAALELIFKTPNSKAAFDAVDGLGEDYDELRLWLDENIPKEYQGKAIYRAYDCLSHADILNSRIRRWQHWRLLAYVRELLVAGVQHAKDCQEPQTETLQHVKVGQAVIDHTKRLDSELKSQRLGASLSPNKFIVKYARPTLLLKLWIRSAREKKALAEIEQLNLHASLAKLKKDFLPYWKFIRAGQDL